MLRCVQLFVLLSFCVLPAVTRSLFLAFHCESYGFDDFTSTSKLHLTASLDIECGSAEHQRIVDLAGFFIFLWPVAMPLLYALLLWKARHAIRHHQPTFLYRATRFLHHGYEDYYFWYEVPPLPEPHGLSLRANASRVFAAWRRR